MKRPDIFEVVLYGAAGVAAYAAYYLFFSVIFKGVF